MGIGFGIETVAQFGYRWKDKIDLSLGGGLEFYNQEFTNDQFKYQIAYIGTQFRGDLDFLFPLNNNKHSDLSIGVGGGMILTTDDNLTHSEHGFYVLTQSVKGQRYFVAPHIGFHQKIKDNHLTMSITFKRHIAPNPLYTVELIGPGATASNTFHGSYFGLHVKYDWMLNKRNKKPKLTPVIPTETLPPDLVNRPTKMTKHMKVSKRFVTIKLWDHSAIDGDTVSVQLNEDIILVAHMLKRRKKVLRVELDEGKNLLTLMAHNQGTSGENTCTVQIKHRGKKQRFVFKTNETRHETMEIFCRSK